MREAAALHQATLWHGLCYQMSYHAPWSLRSHPELHNVKAKRFSPMLSVDWFTMQVLRLDVDSVFRFGFHTFGFEVQGFELGSRVEGLRFVDSVCLLGHEELLGKGFWFWVYDLQFTFSRFGLRVLRSEFLAHPEHDFQIWNLNEGEELEERLFHFPRLVRRRQRLSALPHHGHDP